MYTKAKFFPLTGVIKTVFANTIFLLFLAEKLNPIAKGFFIHLTISKKISSAK